MASRLIWTTTIGAPLRADARPIPSPTSALSSTAPNSAAGAQGSPHFLIGIYCGLAGCDFLASALLFITGGVPLPCDSVNLAFLAKAACGRLAFYSTALKL